MKILAGNPGHRPLNKNEPTPARGFPACPRHLDAEAREEWQRICDELDQMGLLTTADRPALAVYCVAWSRWIDCEEKVKELGAVTASPKTGVAQYNPYLTIANAAATQMVKLLQEFGLTPAARTKVHAIDRTPPDEDDFAELARAEGET